MRNNNMHLYYYLQISKLFINICQIFTTSTWEGKSLSKWKGHITKGTKIMHCPFYPCWDALDAQLWRRYLNLQDNALGEPGMPLQYMKARIWSGKQCRFTKNKRFTQMLFWVWVLLGCLICCSWKGILVVLFMLELLFFAFSEQMARETVTFLAW